MYLGIRYALREGSYTVDPPESEENYWWNYAIIEAIPAAGYEFDVFRVGTGSGPYQEYRVNPVTVTNPDTSSTDTLYVYIEFKKIPTPTTFTVVVQADPPHGGTVTGGGTYSSGATCTITATPNENDGYRFVTPNGWTSSNGETANTATHSFQVTADVTWTAHFRTYRLLYATGGRLLCDSSGRLLYNG